MSEDREPRGDAPVEPDEDSKASRRMPPPPPSDPADEVPVPGAMSAAEIDERARVVETLRREQDEASGEPTEEP
jgi:hypothetical protein